MAKKSKNSIQNGLLTTRTSSTTPLTMPNTTTIRGTSNGLLTVNNINVMLETDFNKLLDYIRYIETYMNLENKYDYAEFSKFESEDRAAIILSQSRKNKIDNFFKNEDNNI